MAEICSSFISDEEWRIGTAINGIKDQEHYENSLLKRGVI